MENLVISVFNTESEAYQSFADLKAFRQTQTTKVAQIALVKNENGHIVEKERYDFCLLYTSPSPRDRQKSRMPSSA